MRDVLAEVREERARQNAKWGEQDHPDGTGPHLQPEFYPHRAENMAALAKHRTDMAARDGRSTFEQILTEEYFEAIAEEDPSRLRAELVQVAAVAVRVRRKFGLTEDQARALLALSKDHAHHHGGHLR